MSCPAPFWLYFFIDLSFDLGCPDRTIQRPEIDFDVPGLGRIAKWEDAAKDLQTGAGFVEDGETVTACSESEAIMDVLPPFTRPAAAPTT